jgi:hypothetical protein
MILAQQIRSDILESLFVTPVTIYPQGNPDSMGDTVEGAAVNYLGYVYENAVVVINAMGKEELSNMQIYLKGDEAKAVALTSLVTCLDATKQRIIARKVYRGRQAAEVIGILYLP